MTTRGPLEFFAELEAAGAAALEACAVADYDIAVGGACVRLRFAGPAYAESVLPALEHLAAPAGCLPDATVSIWDSASTGVAAPPCPWRATTGSGPVGFDHPVVHTTLDDGFGCVTMWDTARRVGVVWAPSAHELPWWERAAPLRPALHWATAGPGRNLIHAGAVGDRHGGVLLAGRGGSGKSTLALACVEHGLRYAGDDYVVLTMEPSPAAHTVYRSAKLHPGSLRLLPGFAAAGNGTAPRAGDKLVVDIPGHRPDRMAASLPISAVVHPQVTGAAEPVLRRVSARDALMTLAPSTVYQLPGHAGEVLATLGALTRRVPSYVLELGPDPAAAAAVVAGIVEDARA